MPVVVLKASAAPQPLTAAPHKRAPSLLPRRNQPAHFITHTPPLPHGNYHKHPQGKGRIFFLDVNPLCYKGSQPSLSSFANWLSLFFSDVSLRDPVIAVLDGDGGNEYRRRLLPSYKAHRRRVLWQPRGGGSDMGSDKEQVVDVLQRCNVPVVKINGYEADDVVATLTDQVLEKGFQVVIGSPDKDFKQLISENVQIVMPMPEFARWSFYTIKHYVAQYKCDPSSDLSLSVPYHEKHFFNLLRRLEGYICHVKATLDKRHQRCILGDEVDGVPGIQHLAPGFGRKTALKLLKKHGSLENLLSAAAIRTVGKHYAQDALTKYADYLRKNYEVLSLRRDAKVYVKDEWLLERDTCNDSLVLSSFIERLSNAQKLDNKDVPFYRRMSIKS